MIHHIQYIQYIHNDNDDDNDNDNDDDDDERAYRVEQSRAE
jgi:hypothetical protein